MTCFFYLRLFKMCYPQKFTLCKRSFTFTAFIIRSIKSFVALVFRITLCWYYQQWRLVQAHSYNNKKEIKIKPTICDLEHICYAYANPFHIKTFCLEGDRASALLLSYSVDRYSANITNTDLWFIYTNLRTIDFL